MNSVGNEHERIAAVVAAEKDCYPLQRCLGGLRTLLANPADLIFVDNGSQEMLSSRATEFFPDITVIRLPKNRFFCGGYNAGIRLAIPRGYEFVLIANADVEVTNPNFMQGLLDVARRWPQAAFLGPQVFWRDLQMVQKTCLQFPSILRSSWQWVPWRIARRYFEKQPLQEAVVDFLNGVCVLCRVKALKEIGLMDENMGGYVEDTDWGWRARQKGWVSLYAPVPSVIHHENESGYEPYSLKTFLLKRNTVYWYLKIGRRGSSWNYAQASIALAIMRLMGARNADERRRHRYFLRRLIRAYRGLLRGEELGGWFGPPIGPWENEHGF